MKCSMRIAVAEDEPDVRDYFRRILPQLGHECVGVAADGQELVQLCRDQRPDLVITDLRMPGMDGDQAMKLVCAERPTPCIFVTAFSKPIPDGNGFGQFGWVCLTKPVSRDELNSAILQVTAPNPEAEGR